MIFTLIYYLGALIKNLNNEKVYFALMDIFIYMDNFMFLIFPILELWFKFVIIQLQINVNHWMK